jgi:hypothetical protein
MPGPYAVAYVSVVQTAIGGQAVTQLYEREKAFGVTGGGRNIRSVVTETCPDLSMTGCARTTAIDYAPGRIALCNEVAQCGWMRAQRF